VPELEWVTSIAAVVDAEDIVRGTAFFVGDDVAMTCQHVLAAGGDGHMRLRRYGSEELEDVLASDPDVGLDLALVRVSPKAGSCRLALATQPSPVGQKIISHGFPRDHPIAVWPNGIPLDKAAITGPTIINWRGQPVDQLTLFGSGFQEGFSGAPAVDAQTGQVVGILTRLESTERAYAIPAKVARLRWPSLPTGVTTTGTLFAELTKVLDAVAPSAWEAFDPSRLNCVIVTSERADTDELSDVLAEVLARPQAIEIWNAFTNAVGGRRLLAGETRSPPTEYTMQNIQPASFGVLDAFESFESLSSAARLLVESDLALFDVTGFEPGVMLLLGIRSATRRGVTIASHGAGWHEGQPLDRPFNLSDLSLSSHSASTEVTTGTAPRVERLAARIRLGFEQYARHPNYLDLPVYDAIRQLGSQEDAWASIPLDEEVLVLCSYHARYFPIWQQLRIRVQQALAASGTQTTVARLLDTATPQLVSQTLYERVRRCAACIADWTWGSPSTFLELGVRLVASPWGAVQMVERGWLAEPADPRGEALPIAGQVQRMRRLFDPLVYDVTPDQAIGKRIAAQLISIREQVQGRTLHPVRQAATEALARSEERLADPDLLLSEEADSLNHVRRTRTNVPQALFYEATRIKADEERAALERRVAAWLYLEHRVHARDLPEEDSRKALWQELGEIVVADLYASEVDADVDLATEIEERLS
jgi:hypothetical protein